MGFAAYYNCFIRFYDCIISYCKSRKLFFFNFLFFVSHHESQFHSFSDPLCLPKQPPAISKIKWKRKNKKKKSHMETVVWHKVTVNLFIHVSLHASIHCKEVIGLFRGPLVLSMWDSLDILLCYGDPTSTVPITCSIQAGWMLVGQVKILILNLSRCSVVQQNCSKFLGLEYARLGRVAFLSNWTIYYQVANI